MKRAWMLLLAVIALVALMTIPAMAAETHEHTTALEAGAVTISQSGTYYLEGDTAVSVTVTAGEVTICLNGHAWTNGTGLRPLTVSGTAKVTLCDCSATPGSITGADVTKGITSDIWKYNYTEAQASAVIANHCGGTIHVSGGELNVADITITGGQAVRGGAVYVGGGTVKINGTADKSLTVNGGVVVAAVKQTKNSETTTSAVNFSGSGGAFFVNGGNLEVNYCTVNGGNVLIFGYSRNGTNANCADDIIDFTTTQLYTKFTLDSQGGSVLFAGGGTVTIKNSTLNGYIANSVAKRGGTIYVRKNVSNASVTLDNTAVTATWSSINGPLAQVDSGGTLTIQGDSVIDSSNLSNVSGDLKTKGMNYGAGVTVAGGTLNIKGGTLKGFISNNSGGGTLSMSSGTINMTGGTITDGRYITGSKGGGNVLLTGGTFNMSGGKICSGNSTYHGGNIYINAATAVFNLTGGTIEDGIATQCGGNVRLESGSFYIGTQGSADVTSPAILRGKNTTKSVNGGSVFVASAGNLYIYSGRISEGETANVGGNIYINGRLEMSGGLITGGKAPANGSSSYNVSAVNADIYLSGGQIDGAIACTTNSENGSVLEISGNAKIGGTGITLTGDSGKWLPAVEINLHDLADDALVTVRSVTSYGAPSYVAAYTNVPQAYLKQLEEKNILKAAEGSVMKWDDGGVSIYPSTENRHCLCGRNIHERAAHAPGCLGYDVKWSSWNGTTISANGYYELNGDKTLTSQTIFRKRAEKGTYNKSEKKDSEGNVVRDENGEIQYNTDKYYTYTPINVYCDLNGYNLTYTNTRALQAWYGASVTLSNSKPAEGGVITAGGQTGNDNFGVWQLLTVENKITDIKTKEVVIHESFDEVYEVMQGVTLRFDRSANTVTTNRGKPSAHGVSSVSSCTFTLYGGAAMIGDPDADGKMTGSSPVLTVGTGATFNMHPNSVITGGLATNYGGAVYMDGGVFNMLGGTINGGEAKCGGAVYVNNGTFNHYDGTISGGKAKEGGNIYIVAGAFNSIPNPASADAGAERKIIDGQAFNTTDHARAGNIRLAGGTVTLQGTEVSGGEAKYEGAVASKYAYGGNIYMVSNTTLNLLGGTVVSDGEAKGTQVTVTDGKETRKSTWAPGGNIMMDGGSLSITDSTITGGSSVNGSTNLYINSGAVVTMESGKIEATYEGKSSIHMQGGTFTINGGEIVVKEGVVGACNIGSNNKFAGSLTINGGTISGGNVSSGNGGNIQLHSQISLTITGGTISGGSAAGNGGNIWLQGSGTIDGTTNTASGQVFTMTGGTIENGKAQSGGNIYIGNTSVSSITGSDILDGEATGGGGNICLYGTASLDFASGTISGGFAKGSNGGNIYSASGSSVNLSGTAVIKNGKSSKNENGQHGNGANIALYGTLTMTGGSILQEASNRVNWTGDGGNIYMNSQGGTAVLKGGTINGWVCVADYATFYHYPSVTLGGDIRIKNDTAGSHSLYLHKRDAGNATEKVDGTETQVPYPKTWAMIAIDGLTADAEIGLTCYALADDEMRVITTNAAGDLAGAEAWQSCFYNDITGNVIGITADNKLFMAKAAIGATVSGGDICYEMPTAIAKAGQNGMIQLQSNYNGEMTIPSGVWVDLNGKTLAGKVTVTGGDLHLIDSLSADYKLDQDKDGNFIYGKLTATVDGTVKDSFTTQNQNGYTGNHRYIVLQDADGTYHAHRIYLAVKGVVLYPQGPHLRYHTEFKCDQVVAKDAKYGVQISGIPYDATEAKTSTKLYSAAVAGAGVSNSRIAGLTNILVNEDAAILNHLATMDYTACGYISVNGQEFTSASYTTTLKDVVEGVDKMWGQGAEGVTETIKPALVEMYETYAAIMEGWELPNIKAAAAAKKQ